MSAAAPRVVTFAGLGGQGVLSAARLLGEAAFARGIPVTVGQLHGMSQRGGAVESTVCFGGEGLLGAGTRHADVLVGLEMLEALRLSDRLGPASVVVVNRFLLPPPSAAIAHRPVPSADAVLAALHARAGSVHVVELSALAERAGSRSATNAAALGTVCALSLVPLSADDVLTVLRRQGGRNADANEKAFALGYAAVPRAAAASRA